MERLYSDRTAEILVVGHASYQSDSMVAALGELGFTRVRAVPSLAEAVRVLEGQRIDWLIAPLATEQEVNGLQILKLTTIYQRLKALRTTFILEDTELYCLPLAFELGMLSWLPMQEAKVGFKEAISGLLKTFEGTGWNSCLTAGEYLWRHLGVQNSWSAAIELEKSLIQLFPERAELLLNLAKANYQLGNVDGSLAALRHAGAVDRTLAARIDELIKEYSSGPKEDALSGTVHGLDTCVVVDPDSTVHTSVRDVMESIGARHVQTFSDGNDAWEWLRGNAEPHLLVQEWRIPKVSGPVLVQRVRQHGHHNVPIMVLSSLVKPNDIHLLREMGVSSVVAKPFAKQDFLRAAVATIQQHRVPTETQSLERKIRQLIAAKNFVDARPLFEQFDKDPTSKSVTRVELRAEFSFHDGKLDEAKKLAIDALRVDNQSIPALNLLGKCSLLSGEPQTALKFYERAQELSPQNIERLCTLAEVKSELGQVAEAEATLQVAEAIDESNVLVAATGADIALAEGNVNKAREIMAGMNSFVGILAMMNNRAVSLARLGRSAESIPLYQNAIAAVPDSGDEVVPILHYNLALAYIRAGQIPSSQPALEMAIACGASRVLAKSTSLKDRVVAREQNPGGTFRLREKPVLGDSAQVAEASRSPPTEEDPKTRQNDFVGWYVARGEMCCHLVYQHPGGHDTNAHALLSLLPPFAERCDLEGGAPTPGAGVIKGADA